eukprot:Em0009g561a
MKRLRRKMLEEKCDKEMSAAKVKKLRSLESNITTMMSKVTLDEPPPSPQKEAKVNKPRYISVPHPPKVPSATDPDTTILEPLYSTSPASSFDDSVLDPDYNPHPSCAKCHSTAGVDD